MKQQLKHLLGLLLVLATSIGLVSCEEDPTGPGDTGSKPEIVTFNATPGAIDIGSNTTLTWTVTGATKLTIDSALGEVTGQSQLTISPSQTATYTLRASNSKGEVTKDVTVTVNNPSDPGAPNNPKALVASPGNPGIIALNWTGSAGSTMYVIERKSAADFKQVKALAVNSYSHAGLYPGVEYTYRVRAINGSGARSGWSNYAKAIAPGTAPVVSRIELTPSNPTTMQPNQTVQLNAIAYDASNNALDFSQDIFTWNSSSILNATVDQDGLVTSGNAQGVAEITASVGGKTSNVSKITVSVQKNKTLVIYNPRFLNSEDNFAVYASAFQGIAADFLSDRGANGTPTSVTIEQIEDYESVFYFSHDDNNLHATTRALLKLYSQMQGKKLILMGNSNMISSDASMLSTFGLKAEGWRNSNSANSTFAGGAGTVMEGFSFQYTGEYAYFSELVLKETNPATPAFSGTYVSNDKEFVAAVQRTLPSDTKIFFAGFVLENVQANLRDDFIQKLMSM